MSKGIKEKIIELFKTGKSYNEISKILNCSKGTISFHCKKLKMYGERFIPEKIKEYQEYYNTVLSLKDTSIKFNISRQTLSKYLIKKERKKSDIIKNHKNYRKIIKQKCIDYKGGKCELCGYNNTIKALEFHHKNPLEKDFQISGGTRSFDFLKTELDKCILVCANCHREIHDGLHTDIYPLADTE